MLLVAHTALSLRYVLEHYALLKDDPRLSFAVTQGSDDFGLGVAQTISRLGLPIVAWDDAIADDWDLALFGTHGGEIFFRRTAARAHVQHGLGAGKLVDGDDFTYGPKWALWEGRPKYDVMIEASHTVQRRAVAACPPLAGIIAVVGDLLADRLLAASMQREQHRAALGIAPDQVAVLFISTWGPHGTMLGSTGPALLQRVHRLPERYKPLLSMHPHLWQARRLQPQSQWARQLTSLERGRLRTCGPNDSWIPFLAAADVAVIDHSSLGLYFGLLGRPTVAVPVSAHVINPGSQLAALRACSPTLEDPGRLEVTLDLARASYDPHRVADRCGEIVSYPGEAADRTRRLLYHLLTLPEPRCDAPRLVE